jgi:IPT/TIG domain
MQPEDRLDTLLSLPGVQRDDSEDLAELEPLLAAAALLTDLGGNEPTAEFSAQLEARFLDQVTEARSRVDAISFGSDFTLSGDTYLSQPGGDDLSRIGNDYPTLPNLQWQSASDAATEADGLSFQRQNAVTRPRPGRVWRRALWSALAAVLLLAIGATTFTAAASARPGTPLYGLHRWEQDIQVQLAGSAADRVRLHIGYAHDALAALDDAVLQRQFGASYDDALATFGDEASAAITGLGDVPAGATRDALAAQVAQVEAEGRADLHAALAALPWAERVSTTATLAAIGDNVLQVAQAEMVYAGHGQHLWQVTITGAGFQQGARLLANGQPAGTVLSVTPTTLVAQLPGDDSGPLPVTLGVANPDDTAALTTRIDSHEQDDSATPASSLTPTAGDDHGGGHGGGNSGPGGGGSSTPGTSGDGGH